MDINTCEAAQIKIMDVRSLILLLPSPEASTSVMAAESLGRYADNCTKETETRLTYRLAMKNRNYLLTLGVIKPLIDLCNSPDKKIKRAGVACLASVTDVAESTPDMKRKELMEALVKIISTEDQVDILDEAAFTLASIAKDFSSKAEIKKLGAIPALVKLLDLPDPDVKKNSAAAISSLLEDFGIRSEIRYANGLRPLLDLFGNEHPEVQEYGLKCFIKASEDATNRSEFKKLNITKRILEYLAIENNSSLFALALSSFLPYLEDSETILSIANQNGVSVLTNLISNDDNNVKRQAAYNLSRALKLEKNQVLAKETGVIPTLASQINSNDTSIVTSAAISISALAKNEANLLDMFKLGVVDILLKIIQTEEKESRREALAALATFSGNAKIRTKIRNAPDNIILIMKLLSVEDGATIINSAECLTMLCEDTILRAEIVKAGTVPLLVTALDQPDTKVQSAACLALSRILLESEAQTALSKIPKVMNKFVELIQSTDINVCRNSSYTLSIAVQNDAISSSACQVGAIDALIQLSKDSVRRSKKFATEALEKLLNSHLSAKYWLLNHLTGTNIIVDGFYDIGYAGTNLEHVNTFPSLNKLSVLPADKKREIILVDSSIDPTLVGICTFLSETVTSMPPESQIKAVAIAVSKLMGGAIDPDNLSSYNYKFKISEMKLKLGSNVIPVGQITQGTFYHRALLFKVLCDKIGLKPCNLIRGEYNRAWNTIDVKCMVLSPPPKSAQGRRAVSSRVKANVNPDKNANSNNSTTQSTMSPAEQKLFYLGAADLDSIQYTHDDVAVVDLMFEPGRLMPSQSAEALKYQRQFQ